MRKLASVLLAILWVLGCAYPSREPNLILHGDVRFTAAERQCMVEAAEQLSEQTDGFATIGYDWNYNPDSLYSSFKQNVFNNRVVRWTSATPELREYEDAYQRLHGKEFRVLGQTNGNDIHKPGTMEIRLVVDRLTNPHMCKLTMMHEIGHIYGLDHLPANADNIMHPTVVAHRTACYKEEDLRVFCSINGCNFAKMSPCGPERLTIGGVDASECKEP